MKRMWGIIEKIKMFDRLAKSVREGARTGVGASLCGARATTSIVI